MKERNENAVVEFDEAGVKRKKGRTKGRFKRGLGVILAGALGIGVAGLAAPVLNGGTGSEEVYAKNITEKNAEAKQRCDNVVSGSAPTYNGSPYTSIDVDGDSKAEVYRGGNAKSGNLDNDRDDFASVLPYGNVYVDVTKLNFTDPNYFKVDIKDTTNFTWVADQTHYDNMKNATGINGIKAVTYAGGAANQEPWTNGSIAYIGGLKPYLSASKSSPSADDSEYASNINQEYLNSLADTAANKDANGNTQWTKDPQETSSYNYLDKLLPTNSDGTLREGYVNKVKANDGDYLYRFTFKEAAILPDGTRGDLVLDATAIEMESSIDVAKGAPIGIQGANLIGVNPVYVPLDASGNLISSGQDSNGVTLYTANAGGATQAGRLKGSAGDVNAYIPPSVKVGNKNVPSTLNKN